MLCPLAPASGERARERGKYTRKGLPYQGTHRFEQIGLVESPFYDIGVGSDRYAALLVRFLLQ